MTPAARQHHAADAERDEAKVSCAAPIDAWGTMCLKPAIWIDRLCRKHLDRSLRIEQTPR